MIAALVSKLLGAVGANFLDRVLSHIERKANSDIERRRIEATRQAAADAQGAAVVRAGMAHPVFWIVWLMAAAPTAAWYGWGMMDSTFNGALPDVSELPPQLKVYADVIITNIFYVGGGAAGLQALASALRSRK